MSTFGIYRTEATLPGRAAGVRAGGLDVSVGPTGVVGIGEAIFGLGRELFERRLRKEKERKREEDIAARIAEKRQQMMDANFSVQAKKIRDLADEEFRQFKVVNPQETWEDFRRRQTEKVGEEVGKLQFSPDALVKETIKSEAYADVETAKALTDSTLQLRKDTIEAQSEALTDAFRAGEPEGIVEAIKRYRDNGANMGKDKVEVLNDIKTAQEEGEGLRKQDILDGWRDRIAESPIVTAEFLNRELEARKTGKGIIPVLTSSEIQSLLNTATNRQAQLLADTEREINVRNKAEETRLHDEIVDGKASITDIAKSFLPAEAKRRLERDIGDVAQRNIARNWAIQDSSDATEGVNAILINIEAGTQDINESRTNLYELSGRKTPDGRSILTQKTFEKTLEQIKKGGRDAIDLFTDEQTSKVENSLTFRLTERDARLRVRAEARTLTSREKRQFSTTGFLLQVANHQLILYNETLAQRLRTLGIEDTSGKEAKAEAVKIWEVIKRKPLETQINDFLVESGQQLVRPFGFPKETWESSDARNRAAIVEGVSKGFDNNQILEALIK